MSIRSNEEGDSRKWWLWACFLMLFVILFLDAYIAAVFEKRDEKLAQAQTLSAASHIRALSITQVELPPVPQSPLVSKTQKSAQAHEKLDTESASRDEIVNKEVSKAAAQMQEKERVDQVMSSLLKGRLSISLPDNDNQRARMLKYMYRCLGVGLAAIDRGQVNTTLMPLSKLPENASRILRQLSGSLSDFERSLSLAYAPNQSLVRVYPQSIDLRLSNAIAQQLSRWGEASLQNFKAKYVMRQGRLHLSDIVLNSKPLNDTWPLSHSHESSGCLY